MATRKMMNCDDQNESYVEDCKLKQPENVKFFSGQLLNVADFDQEKNYFNEKRHLLNRSIHGSGIVCGLEVTKIELIKENCICGPEGNVETISRWIAEVSAGVALDCLGREIIVSKNDRYIVLEKDPQELSEYFGLYIKRKDHLTNPVPSVHTSSCEEKCCYSRILEDFKFVFENLDQSVQIFFDSTTYAKNEQVIVNLIEPLDKDIQSRLATLIIPSPSGEIRKPIDLLQEKTLAGMSIFSFSSDPLELLPSSKITVEYTRSNNSGEDEIYTSSAYVGGSTSDPTLKIIEKKRLGEDYYKVWLKKCMCCENPNEAKVLLSVLRLGIQDKKIEMLEEESTLLRNTVYNNPMLYDLITRKPPKPSDGAGEPSVVNTGTEVFTLRRNKYQTRQVMHGIKSTDGSPPAIVLGLVGTDSDNENEVKFMEDMLLFSNISDIFADDGEDSIELHSVFFKAIKIDKEKFKIFIVDFRRQEETPHNKYRIRWWAIPSKAFPS